MDSDEEFQPRRRQSRHRTRAELRNLRRKFSPQEDEKLAQLVQQKGAKRWDEIARDMPGRTGRQCRDRFQNYLQPELTNGPWTEADDRRLREKVTEIGLHWSVISSFFPGRSQSNVKNRWYSHLVRGDSPQSSGSASEEDKGGVVIGEGKCVMMKQGKNRYVCVPFHPEKLEKKAPDRSGLSVITWDRDVNLLQEGERCFQFCQ